MKTIMKKAALLCSLILCLNICKAQYVPIPDANFGTWLNGNGYSSCLTGNSSSGWQLDTVCSEASSDTIMICQNANISDLTGMQYFKRLRQLWCSFNQLTSLPPLPDSLTVLLCSYNQLTSLPALPASLYGLSCYNNQLTSLPTLPISLDSLDCMNNPLGSLPSLPAHLTFLNCQGDQLASLPTLPTFMTGLFCSYNTSLYCLPRIDTIQYLEFVSTGITCIPDSPVGYFYPSVPICTTGNTHGCTVSPVCHLQVQTTSIVHPTYADVYATINGANGSASGSWSGVSTTVTDTIYSAHITISGVYCFSATDSMGCSAIACDTINISPSCNLSLAYNVTNVNCISPTSGQIQLNGSGGSAPYAYKEGINGAWQYQNLYTGLSTAIDTFYVRDTLGCAQSVVAAILTSTFSDSISYINLGGGQYQFTGYAPGVSHPGYFWYTASGTIIDQGGNYITYSLPNGPHTITLYVMDSTTLCLDIDSVVINASSVCTITLTDSITNTSCGNNNGIVRINASGGTAPYNYASSNGIWIVTNTFYNLAAGTDTFYVRDTTGCIQYLITTVGINGALVPSVTIAASENSLCAGSIDTFRASPINGGSSPIYQWYRNGIAVGSNLSYYITNSLSNNDSVWVVLTSSLNCASPLTVSSAALMVTVNSCSGLAGPNQTVCANSIVTMAATGAGSWIASSQNPSPVTIASPSSPTTTVSGFTIPGIYDFQWNTGDTILIYVNPVPPAILLSASGICPGSDTLLVHNIGLTDEIQWYMNGNVVQTSTVPAYTIAGGNGTGMSLNQLNTVMGLTVDPAGNVYVADQGNNRILKFPAGSTSATNGVIVAGGNGVGAGANQLYEPYDVVLDASGNLYVADGGNHRIQKFPAGSTSATNGVTVAGGNGLGTAANQLDEPYSLAIDASGNIYVTDAGNNRIQKFPAGGTSATNGVTVAGGNGSGSAANQFNIALGIALDASGNLYVCDDGNNRVQKFPAGSTSATSGVTVAGGNGNGSTADQLFGPRGIYVDASNNIYVADEGNNRIQKFPSGSSSGTNGITVAGTSHGSNSDELNDPTDVYVDASGNIYISDSYNYRIQEWTGSSIDSIYMPSASGSYTAVSSWADGCSSYSDTLILNSCVPDTVWPGDADNNRMVDNNDLLTIGLGYDSMGPVRTIQSNVWQADPAIDWTRNFSIYAPLVNFVHADCNGDGIINADDTLAIVQNFGLSHSKSNGYNGVWRTGLPGLTLNFSQDTVLNGDTLSVGIILGSQTVPANNVYGLAFTFNYDPMVVDSNKVNFQFISSWLGSGANSISINKGSNGDGTVKAAITGIDHLSRSGNGQIATFVCVITTGNVNGKDLSYYKNINYISDITAIDQYGNVIQINAGIDSNEVGFSPSGINEIPKSIPVAVYPNPASNMVKIAAGSAIDKININDVLGQTVQQELVNGKLTATLDISNLVTGIYTIYVATKTGTGAAKLIVNR